METELDTLLGGVQSNITYQRAVSAQENFDKTMLRVNEWILDGIKRGCRESHHHARLSTVKGREAVH